MNYKEAEKRIEVLTYLILDLDAIPLRGEILDRCRNFLHNEYKEAKFKLDCADSATTFWKTK